MADYDIGEAFERIQDELLSSMMRNMAHHRKLEEAEGLKYEQWQAQQLQALNEYVQNNPQRFAGTYRKMNSKINAAIRAAYKQGRMDEEIRILQAIKKGYRIQRPSASMQSEFFTINERALNELLDEVGTSVGNVQTAILRRANDEYRKAQFNAQVYFNSGAGTLGQAVDMAVHDMLARGLSCVQYKNGRIVGAADYARMALRTARTRAYLQGEASMRDEWGINTVVVKSRSLACPKCIQWVGKVYYDDQWGHVPVKDKKYPRLSEAIKGGLYHPNCKDIHSTYFEGISEPPKPPSEAEIIESQRQYQAEQKKQYIQRNIDKYRRLEKGSVEPENKSKYAALRKQWTERKNAVNDVDNSVKSGIIDLKGKLSNIDVRKWYIEQNNQIPSLIDKSKTLEEQAKQACQLRNNNRFIARELMKNQEERKMLDVSDPIITFEELVKRKMENKSLTYEEALTDILKTATKTRKTVNKKLGLEE